ncbi:ATP synthase subunit H, mitochondrial [Nakaseomyces glabratus]|uniref:ATP synthase subunit H, mitochondrial n=1 Tax=Candida glabrata TaxID=5478 RepID=A0A0W0CPD1_CANGB|nr:ATP synthase complex subunit h [Nakaseomyces glabratus]KAH7585588.1 ATP synthase complex subunit h [Nakaseomyces glabratus]KAH7587276.1 ATP synthase complex subunit h [Nakaseomyces glabratus]KAH7599220.1 ATP synthase complex subunit h [Nakaseomyces glabratus]KAH7612633.1 ATP synthase complex subunit h [Nakaseomyces glabratus]
MFRTSLRQFSSCRVSRNIISDLYLKELKSVKVTPFSMKDAEGNVKPWSPPAKPQAPQSELTSGNDLLKSYKEEPVETLHTQPAETEGATQIEEDWLVLSEEEPAH